MLVEIPPKYSVSQFMGYLKGKSILMINEKWGNMKYKYRNREFWCRGYYVDTVGKNTKKIQEYIRNQLVEDKEIMVSTVLLPPQPQLDEVSLYRSPRIQLSSTTVDLSNIAKGGKKKTEILITNKGKNPLEIRSMQLFTPGIEITLARQKLNAGESTKMKITGYEKDLSRVKTRPRILMITNDPRQQKVVIEIKK